MKIIYNKNFPFKGYIAINICGLIFARSEYKPLKAKSKQHEAIHTCQIIELCVIFFYLWYGVEWLVRYIQYRNAKTAYYNISFEREAYTNAGKENYLTSRKRWAWCEYLKEKK